MDQLEHRKQQYVAFIEALLEEERYDFELHPELSDLLLIDQKKKHFQLLRLGWLEEERIVEVRIHINIAEDGKIWIQENTTELRIDQELLKLGVPANEIVLGLHPPSYRQFSDFAVA